MASTNLQTRQDIFDSTTRIKQLTQQPTDFLTDILVQNQQYACIEWICNFKVLPEVPLPPGSISYVDLATKLQIPHSTIRSVARMAMTANFLCETKDGRLAHNAISAVFVKDDVMANWLSYLIRRSVPYTRTFTQATEKWPNPTKGNQTAYNLAMKTDLPMFDHFKAHPELAAEFAEFMNSQSTRHRGASVDHLLQGLDWGALGNAKVVDVGGNSGSASLALAKVFPNLRFVVQDLAEPIRQARAQASTLPSDVVGRFEFVEHDFFTPQPVKDADVFLMRQIMHDWPDEDAVRILKELAKVMKADSRIVIMDMVLPTPGTSSLTLESALRRMDLTMRQLVNAKEREVEDWHALIRRADETLQIVAIRHPEGSLHSVIEITRSATV